MLILFYIDLILKRGFESLMLKLLQAFLAKPRHFWHFSLFKTPLYDFNFNFTFQKHPDLILH